MRQVGPRIREKLLVVYEQVSTRANPHSSRYRSQAWEIAGTRSRPAPRGANASL
jgi:hypothetical protein